MNLVLADCEEYRKVKRKAKPASGAAPGVTKESGFVESEEKRMLGLAIIRGATVVSCSMDGPPPADPASRLGQSAPGGAATAAAAAMAPGISRPAGRGMGIGLQGPAMGVGGPGFPGAPPGFQPPPFGGRGGPPPGFPPPPGGGFGPPPGFPAGRGFQPPPGFPPQGR